MKRSLTEHDAALYNLVQKSIFIMHGWEILYYNGCFADVTGVIDLGVKNISFLEFVSGKDVSSIEAYASNLKDGQESSCLTSRVKIKLFSRCSEEYVTELSMRKISYMDKEAYLCTLNDITEFYELSRRLQTILDAIPDVIIEFDPTHELIRSANIAIEGLYGVPVDQFEENIFHPIDLVFDEDKEMVEEFYNNLIDEEYGKIEYRIVTTRGQIRWVRDEGEVVYKDRGLGEVSKVYHFIRDVTDRKNRIEQLKASERKYRRIFEHSTDPIFVSSADGKILEINEAAMKLFGFADKEDALAHNIQEIYTDTEKRDIIIDHLEKDGSLHDYPLQIKTYSGEVVDVVVSIGCRKDVRTGKIKSVQVIIHDVSYIIERTELESYRRTLGGIADRINNITQVQVMHYGLIYDYIDALKSASDEEKEEALNNLVEALDNSKRVVYDLKGLGAAVRKNYHNPERPKAVSDGVGGILFDLNWTS